MQRPMSQQRGKSRERKVARAVSLQKRTICLREEQEKQPAHSTTQHLAQPLATAQQGEPERRCARRDRVLQVPRRCERHRLHAAVAALRIARDRDQEQSRKMRSCGTQVKSARGGRRVDEHVVAMLPERVAHGEDGAPRAVLCPLAHSKIIQALKPRPRELRLD